MGFLDELKKITRPYDDEDEDFIDDDEPFVPQNAPAAPRPAPVEHSAPSRGPFSSSYGASSSSSQGARDGGKVVNISSPSQSAVVVMHPERFETAAEIANHIISKRTVVMNLESTDKDTARRLIDFLSGVSFALDGKIKKVSNSTFLITPYNVDLMGDLMDELESSGQYF